jgi:hypothetical protein
VPRSSIAVNAIFLLRQASLLAQNVDGRLNVLSVELLCGSLDASAFGEAVGSDGEVGLEFVALFGQAMLGDTFGVGLEGAALGSVEACCTGIDGFHDSHADRADDFDLTDLVLFGRIRREALALGEEDEG